MKKIFIYYSLSGNGDIVASYLKDKFIDIRKVNTKEPLPNNTVLRILAGGFLAGINHKDKLIDFDNNIENYDEIIIGSPIWNGKLSCPINTVLSELNLNNKQVTFILYSGSSNITKTKKILETKYPQCKIINLIEPKKNQEAIKKELSL